MTLSDDIARILSDGTGMGLDQHARKVGEIMEHLDTLGINWPDRQRTGPGHNPRPGWPSLDQSGPNQTEAEAAFERIVTNETHDPVEEGADLAAVRAALRERADFAEELDAHRVLLAARQEAREATDSLLREVSTALKETVTERDALRASLAEAERTLRQVAPIDFRPEGLQPLAEWAAGQAMDASEALGIAADALGGVPDEARDLPGMVQLLATRMQEAEKGRDGYKSKFFRVGEALEIRGRTEDGLRGLACELRARAEAAEAQASEAERKLEHERAARPASFWREHVTGWPKGEGYTLTLNSYGEGAPGNPVVSMDHETFCAVVADLELAEKARDEAEARIREAERLCATARDFSLTDMGERLVAEDRAEAADDRVFDLERVLRSMADDKVYEGCEALYNGGYSATGEIDIFRHGMRTACNVVQDMARKWLLPAPSPAAQEPEPSVLPMELDDGRRVIVDSIAGGELPPDRLTVRICYPDGACDTRTDYVPAREPERGLLAEQASPEASPAARSLEADHHDQPDPLGLSRTTGGVNAPADPWAESTRCSYCALMFGNHADDCPERPAPAEPSAAEADFHESVMEWALGHGAHVARTVKRVALLADLAEAVGEMVAAWELVPRDWGCKKPVPERHAYAVLKAHARLAQEVDRG